MLSTTRDTAGIKETIFFKFLKKNLGPTAVGDLADRVSDLVTISSHSPDTQLI